MGLGKRSVPKFHMYVASVPLRVFFVPKLELSTSTD